MHRLFKLGGFCFAADHPDTLVFPPNFLRFETKDVQPAYFYTLRFVKSIPNPVGVCTAVREDLIVYRDGEKESRLLGIQGMLGFYALYRELDDTHAEMMIAEDCRGCLVFDPVFASLFALERRMLQKDSFILHSAYIRHRGRAILFSAPSGTGKSTQASLWAQYAGAEIINGDRALLQKVQDCWMARGWPVCGTSGICQNADARLSAVVLLRQAKKNAVRRLSRGAPHEALNAHVRLLLLAPGGEAYASGSISSGLRPSISATCSTTTRRTSSVSSASSWAREARGRR